MNIFDSLKKFKKIFDYRDFLIPINEVKVNSFVDASQVSLIRFKDESIGKMFAVAFDVNEDENVVSDPKVEFNAKASFSVDYLKNIINTFDDSHITISMKTNAPIKIEGKKFIWYLAPRITEVEEAFEKELPEHNAKYGDKK